MHMQYKAITRISEDDSECVCLWKHIYYDHWITCAYISIHLRYLDDNPLQCDCSIRWLPSFLERVDHDSPTCATPDNLNGETLTEDLLFCCEFPNVHVFEIICIHTITILATVQWALLGTFDLVLVNMDYSNCDSWSGIPDGQLHNATGFGML